MNSFEITSGKIVASDPCYEIPTWCQGVIENVKNGTWVAEVEMTDGSDGWGVRVASLTISNKNYGHVGGFMELMNFEGGVDSGQFGFFDFDFYRNDERAKDLEKQNFGENYDEKSGDTWYRAASHITLSENQWGVMPNGAVSSSGIGDGSYSVYGEKDADGCYVGFKVIYMEENDDEDEDNWLFNDYDEDDGDVCGVCNEDKDECICDDDEE